MATETDVTAGGVYINRIVKGHARWFFNLSFPRAWLDALVRDGREVTDRDQVVREVARRLNHLVPALLEPVPSGDADASAAAAAGKTGGEQ